MFYMRGKHGLWKILEKSSTLDFEIFSQDFLDSLWGGRFCEYMFLSRESSECLPVNTRTASSFFCIKRNTIFLWELRERIVNHREWDYPEWVSWKAITIEAGLEFFLIDESDGSLFCKLMNSTELELDSSHIIHLVCELVAKNKNIRTSYTNFSGLWFFWVNNVWLWLDFSWNLDDNFINRWFFLRSFWIHNKDNSSKKKYSSS